MTPIVVSGPREWHYSSGLSRGARGDWPLVGASRLLRVEHPPPVCAVVVRNMPGPRPTCSGGPWGSGPTHTPVKSGCGNRTWSRPAPSRSGWKCTAASHTDLPLPSSSSNGCRTRGTRSGPAKSVLHPVRPTRLAGITPRCPNTNCLIPLSPKRARRCKATGISEHRLYHLVESLDQIYKLSPMEYQGQPSHSRPKRRL